MGIIGNASAEQEQSQPLLRLFARLRGFSMAAKDFNAGAGPGQQNWNNLLARAWSLAVAQGKTMLAAKSPCCRTVFVVFHCVDQPKHLKQVGVTFFSKTNPSGFCDRGLLIRQRGSMVPEEIPFVARFDTWPSKPPIGTRLVWPPALKADLDEPFIK